MCKNSLVSKWHLLLNSMNWFQKIFLFFNQLTGLRTKFVFSLSNIIEFGQLYMILRWNKNINTQSLSRICAYNFNSVIFYCNFWLNIKVCGINRPQWVKWGDQNSPVVVGYNVHPSCASNGVFCSKLINSLAPGRFYWHFKRVIFMLILVTDDWCISFENASDECNWTLLMIVQHWFR